jgi:predicted DsbA family dithiol-disulfide isomerase
MAPTLAAALADVEEPVNFVRVNFPISKRAGARAYRCATAQGASQGEAMADAIFAAETRDKSACEALAGELGLDVDEFKRCVDDPATNAQIDEERKAVRAAGLAGLPTVFIGMHKFEGFDAERSAEQYAAALADPDRPAGAGMRGWGVLTGASLLAGWVLARRRREAPDATRASG